MRHPSNCVKVGGLAAAGENPRRWWLLSEKSEPWPQPGHRMCFNSGNVSAAMEGHPEGLRPCGEQRCCPVAPFRPPAATLILDVARAAVVGWRWPRQGCCLNLTCRPFRRRDRPVALWCRPGGAFAYIRPIRQRLDPRRAPTTWPGRGWCRSGVGTAARLTGPPMWPRSMRGAALTPCSPPGSGGKRVLDCPASFHALSAVLSPSAGIRDRKPSI